MRYLALSVMFLSVVAAPLTAQGRVNARKGFWIGVGLGAGSVGAECDACTADRTTGFSGNVKLGGTFSPSFLLGGEVNGWFRSESGVDQALAFASVVGVWYPISTGPFYLKLGLGGMSYRADAGVLELTATAPSASFGLGYDFRVGAFLSVTAWLNALASSPVDVKLNGVAVPTDDITANLVQFGVGVTWH